MNIKRELGEKIKRIRKQRGFTQEELAEMVDISSRNLSNIEIGANFPKAETLEKIMKALNISTEILFANDHLKSDTELLEEINYYIKLARNDIKTLEKVYKILKDLIDET